jgi:peptidoglycan/LPS O-acetylase OafA/YrhL
MTMHSSPVAAMRAPAKFEPRPLTSSASAHLDFIRASAAWAVMWGHLRALFFVDFSHLYRTNRSLAAIYFMTGFGHQSVMIFFVLSGFLISTSLIKKYIAGTWSAGDYGIDGASRLYVVLIPGLVLGLFWDWAGHLLFRSSGLYSQPLEAFGSIIAQDQLSFTKFVGNLSFFADYSVPDVGLKRPTMEPGQ